MTDTPATNRPPADRLHDIRQRISELRDQEEQLRRGLISGDVPTEGDEYTVTIETKLVERVDLARMRQRVPESVWRPYLMATPTTYVALKRRVAPSVFERARPNA